MSSKRGPDAGWLIEELYAMRQTGRITDLAAGWILQCIYGENGLRQLAQQLSKTVGNPNNA